MPPVLQRFTQKLFSPIDAASVGMFRILFGALMGWQALYYLARDRYIHYYIKPDFHFTYDFFSFVTPVSERFLFFLFILMALAALGIMLGLYYRFSVFVFLITYTYSFLLDRAYYNNHYYFIILLSFLMLFVDCQRWASLDQKLKPRPAAIPFWQLFILRAQIFIVYFFGGIAKLNWDWLQGEPMRTWLRHVSDIPVIGPLFVTSWAPYFFSWGGLAFDLSIGFLLIFKKTRYWAFAAILFFNLTNALIFSIGVFPFLMIAAATLFDDPEWPWKFFKRKGVPPTLDSTTGRFPLRRDLLVFISLYFLVQTIVPLRHWLYEGNVSWTEEGHLFSWHMKLRNKEGKLRIWVTDPKTGERFKVDPKKELNRFQRAKLFQRPQFIYQYVQHLKDKMKREGMEAPVIQVDSFMSLNGRPFQRAIDPSVNLAEAKSLLFFHDEWILPLDPSAKPGSLSEADFDKNDFPSEVLESAE